MPRSRASEVIEITAFEMTSLKGVCFFRSRAAAHAHVAMQLSSVCRAVAMLLRSSCHAVAMQLR